MKAEKAAEPTMDEILASIRKIIAEEPVGKSIAARDESAKEAGAAGGATARASLDDILGMADVPARDEPPAAAAVLPAATTKDEVSLPLPAPVAKSTVTPEPEKPAAEARPFFPVPAVAKATEAEVTGRATGATPAKDQTAKPMDFGAIVPRKSGELLNGPVEPDRKGGTGRLPEWLGRPTAPAGGLAAPGLGSSVSDQRDLGTGTGATAQSAPKDAAASIFPAAADGSALKADGKPTAPGSAPAASDKTLSFGLGDTSSAPRDTTNPVKSTPATPTSAAKPATGSDPATKPDLASANGIAASNIGLTKPAVSAPGALAGKSEPSVSRAPVSSAITGSSSLDATPAAEATAPAAKPWGETPKSMSAPAAKATEPQPDAPARTASVAVPMPVADVPAPVSKPAVLDRSKAVKPSPSSDLVAAAISPAGGVRTLDDTIIELLRPMIRQWLDDNMPRMVEKALRIELAASLQAKGAAAPTKTDPSSKH